MPGQNHANQKDIDALIDIWEGRTVSPQWIAYEYEARRLPCPCCGGDPETSTPCCSHEAESRALSDWSPDDAAALAIAYGIEVSQ